MRADLLSLFSAHEARYHRLGAGVIRGLLAELPQERANETLAAGSILTHTTLRALVAQARADGKLGPREVPDAVLDTPIALLRHEFLMLGRVPSRAQVEEILDLIYLPLLRLHSGAAAPSGR
nr:TetR/AcrR family transcriptional regulator C-terminal ligand-binding domain-containing protein [Leucobacter luti]